MEFSGARERNTLHRGHRLCCCLFAFLLFCAATMSLSCITNTRPVAAPADQPAHCGNCGGQLRHCEAVGARAGHCPRSGNHSTLVRLFRFALFCFFTLCLLSSCALTSANCMSVSLYVQVSRHGRHRRVVRRPGVTRAARMPLRSHLVHGRRTDRPQSAGSGRGAYDARYAGAGGKCRATLDAGTDVALVARRIVACGALSCISCAVDEFMC